MKPQLDGTNIARVDQLKEWIEAREGEHFEFKQAKTHFSVERKA